MMTETCVIYVRVSGGRQDLEGQERWPASYFYSHSVIRAMYAGRLGGPGLVKRRGSNICTQVVVTIEPEKHRNIDIDSSYTLAESWISKGAHVHQKFSCSTCGVRLTITEPNIFYKQGTCSDCGSLTEIAVAGIAVEMSPDNICRCGCAIQERICDDRDRCLLRPCLHR